MIDEEFMLTEAEDRLMKMRVSISAHSAAGIMGIIKAFRVHITQMRTEALTSEIDEALARVDELIEAYVEVLTLAIRKSEAEEREASSAQRCN